MCSVRGIGVADSESTSTSSRSARRSSFCATPNRCSSSTITSPSVFGTTSRDSTRWVPISTSTLPSAYAASAALTSPVDAHARDELDAQREVAEAVAEGLQVLLREDGRRREHQHLAPAARDLERGAQRDLGLPEADVAADQPVHRAVRLEVVLDGLDRARLVLGLRVGERGLEPRHPALVADVRLARARLPLGVQREQLAGELVDGDPRARLERLPGLAAELGERGRPRIGADVARDLAELVVRHEELVLAPEGELDVVARDAGDRLDVEPQELADAVVLVHDVIAGTQIREARERATEAQRGRRPRAAAEDLRGGQQREPERRRHEPAPRRRDAEVDAGPGGQALLGVEHPRLDATQTEQRTLGVAAVRERDDDPHARHRRARAARSRTPRGRGPPAPDAGPRAASAPTRADRAARSPRSARRSRRRGRRPARAREAARCALTSARCSSAPAATGTGSQVASAAMSASSSISGTRPLGHGLAALVVALPGLEVGIAQQAARRRGTAPCVCERLERALREQRVGRDALDLVAEQLDAHRRLAGRREHVDDVAAHRHLAAIVDHVDPLVARRRREPRRGRRDRARRRAPARPARAARPAPGSARRSPRPRPRRVRRDGAGRVRAPARPRGAPRARARSRRRRRATGGTRRAPRRAGTRPRPRRARAPPRRPRRARASGAARRLLAQLPERRDHDRQQRLGDRAPPRRGVERGARGPRRRRAPRPRLRARRPTRRARSRR